LLATSLLLGCVLFWVFIIWATIKVGAVGVLIVLGIAVATIMILASLALIASERDKKGRKRDE
jgi:hypothetical protein